MINRFSRKRRDSLMKHVKRYCRNPNSTNSSVQQSLRLDYILTPRSTHHPPPHKLDLWRHAYVSLAPVWRQKAGRAHARYASASTPAPASGASLRGELLLRTGLPPDWLHGTVLKLIKTKPRKLEGPRLWISLSKYSNLSLKLIHPLHR